MTTRKYSYLFADEARRDAIVLAADARATGKVTHRAFGDRPALAAKDVYHFDDDGYMTIINPSKPYKTRY